MFIQWKSLLILVCSLRNTILCDDVVIDLTSYTPETNETEYLEHVNLTEHQTRIVVTNVDPRVDFFIIQIHSYAEDLTLSYTPTIQVHSHVNGTNIGLFWDRSVGGENDTAGISFYCIGNATIAEHLKILLAVHVYGKNDPVPGGCNMSFETMIAPYQKINYTKSTIEVASQPPSGRKSSCNKNNAVQVVMYHMFLPANDKDETNYFDGISKMMTVERIKKYGRPVHKMDYSKYKRRYSLYRGTGEVFAVIASDGEGSSAYVPAASYGCDTSKWYDDCAGTGGINNWSIACLLFFGMLICTAGHRFFKTSLFLMGYAFGQFVTYIILDTEMFVYSAISGLIWVTLWAAFGMPLLSLSLTFIFAAAIITSTFFYGGIGDYDIFGNDLVFWMTFVCAILSFLLIWSPWAPYSHILALSVVGSYCVVVALSYYGGGTLQYVFINTFRRITVPGFSRAVIDPPFQGLDISHVVTWIALLSLGCITQFRYQKGRPPLPPHSVPRVTIFSERTPLLQTG